MHEQLALILQAGTIATTPVPVAAPVPVGVQAKERRSQILAVPRPDAGSRPATLRRCLSWLEGNLGASDREVRDIRGAVTTVIRVVRKVEDRRRIATLDLPADPATLRPLLLEALPVAMRVSSSRWRNAKSHLVSLLIACGWVSPDVRSAADFPPGVRARFGDVQQPLLLGPLKPFLRFCAGRGVPLDEIGAQHVLAYERWLIHETLDGRPRSTALAVQTAWRRLRRTCPAWPQQELQTQSRVNRKALPTEAFTPDFVADLTAYKAALRNPDPLDPEQGRPLSEASIVGIRGTLLRAATVLAGTGVPLDQITALGVMV